MKVIYSVFFALLFSGFSHADTFVRGYTKSNGTYVAPYTRSSPNSLKSDNYGSSSPKFKPYSEPTNQRDSDHDGTPNYIDNDDNNNGTPDNQETK